MKEGRWCFNPCLFKGHIYLCGCGPLRIEVFFPSPGPDTFLENLNLLVPGPNSESCTVFVDGDLLVVHSKRFIVKCEDQNGQICKVSEVLLDPQVIDKWLNSQPVVAGDLVYIFQASRCFSFDKRSGALISSYQ